MEKLTIRWSKGSWKVRASSGLSQDPLQRKVVRGQTFPELVPKLKSSNIRGLLIPHIPWARPTIQWPLEALVTFPRTLSSIRRRLSPCHLPRQTSPSIHRAVSIQNSPRNSWVLGTFARVTCQQVCKEIILRIFCRGKTPMWRHPSTNLPVPRKALQIGRF